MFNKNSCFVIFASPTAIMSKKKICVTQKILKIIRILIRKMHLYGVNGESYYC